ncbi:RNA-directed DNA polymerase, eukaryota, reverse transcriptase zinc-binding domain protein [Tanacetum coccineum]
MTQYIAGQNAIMKDQQALIQEFKTQVGQLLKLLSQRQPGSLPSNTKTNPNAHVNAVTTRSETAHVVCFFGEEKLNIILAINLPLSPKVGDNEQYLGTVYWQEKGVYVCLLEGAGESPVLMENGMYNSQQHSCGGSSLTSDMIEFNDCINSIEMKDITSSGLFYTWTKNLFKAKAGDNTGVLKKFDRTMANKEFIDKFPQAYAVFLPYLISDHSQNILVTPNAIQARRKAFKFVNFVADKADFLKIIKEERKVLKEYVETIKDEEKILYQKSKIKWLSVGDRNNAYFHKILKSRNHKNIINQISDDKGNRYYGEEVANRFVNHFKKFLGETYPVSGLKNIEALIEKKLSAEDALDMVRMVNDEEIKTAMFQIDDNKAPDPDGFSAYFFKKAWSIVGTYVCNAVKEFFRTGKLLNEVNCTLISLIPKIQTPDKVTNFRPIACCNVLYKCISKIIIDRVGLNQSAFVPNRHIQDNILLSQELLREAILNGFGFHEKMVKWIVRFITSVSFSVCVNGETFGYFKGGRGLRQGDLMSPYLFTLVMEILSLIVQKKVEEKKDFRFHFGCKQLKLTHVCFTDDLLMFCHGDVVFGVLKEAIEEFGVISDLLPNYNKSTIIFGSIRMEDQQSILDCVPFRVEKLPVKYLGLPLTSKRIGAIIARARLTKSKAGFFLLPQGVIKDINKILKGFLWSQGELSKGKAKVAWRNICSPKNQGGLGLKDLVIKHLWYIALDENSIWVKWVNNVKLKGKSIWAVNEEVTDSQGWKNMLRLRDDVRQYMIMKVINREKTSVLIDNWSSVGVLQSFLTHRDMYNGRVKADTVVKEIVNNGICEWPSEWTKKFPILNLHKSITLDSSKNDELVWRSRSGKESNFSVKQVYDDLKGSGEEVTWATIVWFSQNIPKHSFIVWMEILNKLTTQDKVKNWRSYDMMACPLCNQDIDSHQHLFFQCQYANQFWAKAKSKI